MYMNDMNKKTAFEKRGQNNTLDCINSLYVTQTI